MSFVVTKACSSQQNIFVMTNIILSQQKCYRDNHTFVTTNTFVVTKCVFCCNKCSRGRNQLKEKVPCPWNFLHVLYSLFRTGKISSLTLCDYQLREVEGGRWDLQFKEVRQVRAVNSASTHAVTDCSNLVFHWTAFYWQSLQMWQSGILSVWCLFWYNLWGLMFDTNSGCGLK